MENENQNNVNGVQQPTPQPASTPTGASPDAIMVIGTYVLFFLPLIIEKLKKDPFYHFHMKQSLGLLFASVLSGIVASVVRPVGGILQLGVLVLWIISLLSALKGKQEQTPVIGEYFKKINI